MPITRITTRSSFTELILAAVVLLNVFQLFVLPLALLPASAAWAWSLLPLAAVNLTLWALIHEAIHHNLTHASRDDVSLGRLLSIIHGAPFRVLQIGHLFHHRYSRTVRERSEVYDPRHTSRGRAAIAYYFRLLGGLYVYEVLAAVLCLLPARVLVALRSRIGGPETVAGLILESLASPERLREVRVDASLIFALYAGSALAYGGYAWMLVALLSARAVVISLNDNVYHYRTPLEDVVYARDLDAPRVLSALMLNFNLHGAHHRNTRLTWRELRGATAAGESRNAQGWFSAILVQLEGPIAVGDLETHGGRH